MHFKTFLGCSPQLLEKVTYKNMSVGVDRKLYLFCFAQGSETGKSILNGTWGKNGHTALVGLFSN
jgi:hypothetical protein